MGQMGLMGWDGPGCIVMRVDHPILPWCRWQLWASMVSSRG